MSSTSSYTIRIAGTPDDGHSPGHTPRTIAAGDSYLTADSAPASAGQSPQWHLHYRVGELAHYTAWTAYFATVESLAQQCRRSDYGQEITIERRAEG